MKEQDTVYLYSNINGNINQGSKLISKRILWFQVVYKSRTYNVYTSTPQKHYTEFVSPKTKNRLSCSACIRFDYFSVWSVSNRLIGFYFRFPLSYQVLMLGCSISVILILP